MTEHGFMNEFFGGSHFLSEPDSSSNICVDGSQISWRDAPFCFPLNLYIPFHF
jgi:hypothetical protein